MPHHLFRDAFFLGLLPAALLANGCFASPSFSTLHSTGLTRSRSDFGVQQGSQNRDLRSLDRTVASISQRISTYLNSSPVESIVTPGDFSQWPLDLKAGQVVIAEAQSDAFDPALEIADGAGKIVAANDDRYPGDQRPLLLFEAPAAGSYKLRVKGYHNTAGGLAKVNWVVISSAPANLNGPQTLPADATKPLLLEMHLKRGQLVRIGRPTFRAQYTTDASTGEVIAADGLPCPDLVPQIQPIANGRFFLAPVDGVYYLHVLPTEPDGSNGSGSISFESQNMVIGPLNGSPTDLLGKSTGTGPQVWTAPFQAGDLFRFTCPQLAPDAQILAITAPDVSKYSLENPDTNPFFPMKDPVTVSEPQLFPARARDGRQVVARMPATGGYWIASSGDRSDAAKSDLNVTRADKPISLTTAPGIAQQISSKAKGNEAQLSDAKNRSESTLILGGTSYFSVNANAGDILALNLASADFYAHLLCFAPNLGVIRNVTFGVDQTRDEWQLVCNQTGKYLFAVSCQGDGGGGKFSIAATSLPATDFGLGKSASVEVASGQVKVFRFQVKAHDPVILHLNSADPNARFDIYRGDGSDGNIGFSVLNANEKVAIINEGGDTTFIVVVHGAGEPDGSGAGKPGTKSNSRIAVRLSRLN